MVRGFLAVVCVAFPGGMRGRPYNYGEVGCSSSPRPLMVRGFLAVVCVAFPGGMRGRPYNYGEVGCSLSPRHLMARDPLPSR